MLSPTNGDDVQRRRAGGRAAGGDGLEPRVLVRRRAVGPAQHRVVDEVVREDRLGVGALRLQAIGDDGDAAAEGADPAQELGRARHRRRLAAPDPAFQLSAEKPAPSRARSSWYSDVVDHRLVSVEHDGPGAAGRSRRAGCSTCAVASHTPDAPRPGTRRSCGPTGCFGQRRCGDRRRRLRATARERRCGAHAEADTSSRTNGASRHASRHDKRCRRRVIASPAVTMRRLRRILTSLLVVGGCSRPWSGRLPARPAFGGRASGARLARLQASPQFKSAASRTRRRSSSTRPG